LIKSNCYICGHELLFLKKIKKPQKNENTFNFSIKKFNKKFYECKNCFHIYNFHSFRKEILNIYKKNYNFQSHNNIKEKFNSIISIKKSESSNYYRIKALLPFLKKKYKILDVGSGIGVFPYEIQKKGFNIDCLEYDKQACTFLKKIGLRTIRKSIMNYKIPKKYDFLTFNKILEHLPIKNISHVLKHVDEKKKIYIEVPSVRAKKVSLKRQEFFLEHFNIFSKKSFTLLVSKLNYKIKKISDIKEINNKYTLRAIIEKK